MDGSAKKEQREKAIGSKQGSAFITTRRGFCYLTIKCGRHNFHIMRIRAYTIDADDKRQMRRLYPDIDFDWKKIARQLAEKQEVCRRYRSRRRTSDAAHLSRVHAPFYWAHVRRKFFDVHAATGSALAKEALDRIGQLYGIEERIKGLLPDHRRRERQ